MLSYNKPSDELLINAKYFSLFLEEMGIIFTWCD